MFRHDMEEKKTYLSIFDRKRSNVDGIHWDYLCT